MLFIISHIFCYDVWFYVSHIILHDPILYGIIHYIHHSTPYHKLDYAATHVAHYAENLIQPIGFIVPCFFIGFMPVTLVISFSIIIVRGLLRHDHRYSWLIGNHHLLHHKYPRYNFGEYWIDVLCGTHCKHTEEYVYGKIYT